MKNDDKSNSVTESTNPLQSSSQDNSENAIYQFWKKQPGFCLALFSTIIAVCSFAIKAELLLAKLINLRYWGITDLNISVGYDNQLYAMSIIAVCLAIFMGTTIFLDTTLIAYFYKKCKKDENKNTSKSNVTNKKKKRQDRRSKKKAPSEEKKKRGDVVISLFIVIVIWTVLLYIAQGAHIQGPTSHEFIFLVSFISAIILLLIVCSILALIECFYVKRMFIKKKEFLERDESVFEYPIRKFADFRLSKYLSNQKIRQWTCFLLVVIALILPFSLIFNHIVTTNQKEFQVYRDDAIGEVYVLVYRADNVYYFDKAKESDTETITVYTNSQRIIKADDIVLETTKYNIVHRE